VGQAVCHTLPFLLKGEQGGRHHGNVIQRHASFADGLWCSRESVWSVLPLIGAMGMKGRRIRVAQLQLFSLPQPQPTQPFQPTS
jgi:hypothetical protein